jgi:hypothetical protein
MNKEIFIATPMYNGVCTGAFTDSLLQAFQELPKLGYRVKYCPLYNESLITRARNTLTEKFLQEKSDYLVFIDSDQSFRATDIDRMIKEDKDIIGALVPMKRINWDSVKIALEFGKTDLENYSGYFNINPLNQDISNYDIFEVKCVGTGMMIIKKEVLHSLADKVNSYKNNSGAMLGIEMGSKISEFWTTSIDEEDNLLSEDYNFCKIARENMYKIFAVSYPEVTHYGYYGFKGKIN